MSDRFTYHPQLDPLEELKSLLREARQFVSDAGDEEDTEANEHRLGTACAHRQRAWLKAGGSAMKFLILSPRDLMFVCQWIMVANGRVSAITATPERAEEIRRAHGPCATIVRV